MRKIGIYTSWVNMTDFAGSSASLNDPDLASKFNELHEVMAWAIRLKAITFNVENLLKLH